MSKEKWMQHAAEVGYSAMSPEGKLAHVAGCKECKARRRTKNANNAKKWKHEAMLSCGLVRVKGALGGVYYE